MYFLIVYGTFKQAFAIFIDFIYDTVWTLVIGNSYPD